METKECPVCFLDLTVNIEHILPCNCSACVCCASEWIISQIKLENSSINDKSSCHSFKCSKKFLINDVYNTFPVTYQEKINEALFQVYLIKEQDIRKCPNIKCPYAGTICTSSCSESLQCTMCQTQWREYKHLPLSDKILEGIKQASFHINDLFSIAKKKFISKRCPTCNTNIEKNGGCDHMTCSQCRSDFCWVCCSPTPIHNSKWHNYHLIIKPVLMTILISLLLFVLAYFLYTIPLVKVIADWTIIPIYKYNKNIILWSWDLTLELAIWITSYIGNSLLLNVGLSLSSCMLFKGLSFYKKLGCFIMSIMCWFSIYYYGLGWSTLSIGLIELTCIGSWISYQTDIFQYSLASFSSSF